MDAKQYHARFVVSQNKYVFTIIAFALVVAFSLAHYAGNLKSQIVVIAFFSFVGYVIYDRSWSESEDKRVVSAQFDKMEEEDLEQTGLMFKNDVSLSRTPSQYVHVRRREEVMRLINKLQPYHIFDLGTVTATMTVMERFFEVYDAMMSDKSTCDASFHLLQDLRIEAMNLMSTLEFNVPPENVHDLAMISRQLQARTARYMKIASRKCESDSIPKGTFAFGHPSGIDASKMVNEMY
jgi:hypothetical protein